jgi:hypothetical protein
LSDAKPPAAKNTAWPKNDVDRFILAELEKNRLQPSPEADPATLIRRVTLDLTGLAWHPLAVNVLTLATLWWEIAYAAIVWPRLTRRVAIAMAVPVHLGIGLAMGMMEFGLAMLTANMAFMPAPVLRRLLRPLLSRFAGTASHRA